MRFAYASVNNSGAKRLWFSRRSSARDAGSPLDPAAAAANLQPCPHRGLMRRVPNGSPRRCSGSIRRIPTVLQLQYPGGLLLPRPPRMTRKPTSARHRAPGRFRNPSPPAGHCGCGLAHHGTARGQCRGSRTNAECSAAARARRTSCTRGGGTSFRSGVRRCCRSNGTRGDPGTSVAIKHSAAAERALGGAEARDVARATSGPACRDPDTLP